MDRICDALSIIDLTIITVGMQVRGARIRPDCTVSGAAACYGPSIFSMRSCGQKSGWTDPRCQGREDGRPAAINPGNSAAQEHHAQGHRRGFHQGRSRQDRPVVLPRTGRENPIERTGIAYDPFIDQKDPGHFNLIEEWPDRAALDAHCRTEHFTRLVPQINAHQRQDATFILMDAFPA